MRSLWALEELGIPYEHVPTDFASDAKKPDFLAINPNGRVPALVDGDVTLFESMAINLYLARKYDKQGLYPRSAADEARYVAALIELPALINEALNMEAQYRQIVGTDVPALNERAAKIGVAFVTPPKR